MWIFNSFFSKIFEAIFLPFRNFSPWVGMIIISFLTGLLMLFIFRFTSNQEGIHRVKNKIKAHLLELRLFKDSLSLSLKAQGNILRYNLKYISYSSKPMLVMIIPIILILVQLNLWFGHKSLNLEEAAILKVKLEEGQNPLDIDLALEPSSTFSIETPPMRIEEEREINWRLRAKEKGVHLLKFRMNNKAFAKKVAIAQKPLSQISALKVKRSFIDELFNPAEEPLPRNLPVKSIEIIYPSQSMNLFGWHIHWLIVYFALSIIFGFAFKGLFKVEI
jgi:hypothetical protein